MVRVSRTVADEQSIELGEDESEVHVPRNHCDRDAALQEASDLAVLDSAVDTEDVQVSF